MKGHRLREELEWRGLLHQHTEGAFADSGGPPVTGYAGFDPTASSLHVGNLVPVMGLVHLQRHGVTPLILVGGGTGLIGDPSGKSAERQLTSPEVVADNARAVRRQLEQFLDFEGAHGARVRDNSDWLLSLGLVEFLRDVGKHFTVNYMLQKESVKARMDTGISYTEFSYMLLQAYDFLELHQREGVTLQVGGSDQWGNMTAGMELIRRTTAGEAHVITFPLVTTAAGTKFGKTEAGAVWLDPERTSPFRFFQFWLNADDRDVSRYLRYFTLLSREEIEALDVAASERPEKREAQHALATDVTRRVHGEDSLRAAEQVTGLLFGDTRPQDLSRQALDYLRADAPFSEMSADEVRDSSGGEDAGRLDVVKLVVGARLAQSNAAARRLLEQGAISVNKRKLEPSERYVSESELLEDGQLVVGKGKRELALVRVR
jgi:tyrosyl-tRNA synthetase